MTLPIQKNDDRLLHKITLQLVVGIISCWMATSLIASSEVPISMATSKPLEQVVPDQDLVTVSVTVPLDLEKAAHPEPSSGPSDAPLSPKAPSSFRVILKAPKTHPLFTTDFPHVEGSTLLDTILYAPQGTFSFEQVFPIRGDYLLSIIPIDDHGSHSQVSRSSEFTKEFVLRIPENPAKIRALSLFIAALSLICLVSGYILGRGHLSQMALSATGIASVLFALAGQGRGFFLPVLTLNWGEKASAHGTKNHNQPPSQTGAPSSDGETEQTDSDANKGSASLVLDIHQSPESPKVAELATIKAQVTDQQKTPVPARFRLQIKQTEHGQNVFETEVISPSGQLHWQGSYFDGSPHEVLLEAQPLDTPLNAGGADPLKVQKVLSVDVQALEPPFLATFKSFSFLMLVCAAGLIIGLGTALATSPKNKLSLET